MASAWSFNQREFWLPERHGTRIGEVDVDWAMSRSRLQHHINVYFEHYFERLDPSAFTSRCFRSIESRTCEISWRLLCTFLFCFGDRVSQYFFYFFASFWHLQFPFSNQTRPATNTKPSSVTRDLPTSFIAILICCQNVDDRTPSCCSW